MPAMSAAFHLHGSSLFLKYKRVSELGYHLLEGDAADSK